jgi:hypothetical protein
VTNPIRPSGPSPLGAGSPLDQLDALDGAQGSAEAARNQGPSGVSGAAGSASTGQVQGSTAEVLSQLSSGAISRDQAIEALVSEALLRHGAGRLGPSQQADLASVLRTALLDDPVLGSLLR